MVAITLVLVVNQPKKVVRGARFARMINSQTEFSAYRDLVRAPGLSVPEVTLRDTLLERANAEPIDAPELRCGPAAFQSALSSERGADAIGVTVCASYYGIGRIKKSDASPVAAIGFFAVDTGGRWRLVASVPTSADIEDSLPPGFPSVLPSRWANR